MIQNVIVQNVEVNSTSKTRNSNEKKCNYRCYTALKYFSKRLSGLTIEGPGAYDWTSLFTEEEIENLLDEELTSKFLLERFGLASGARINDLVDAVPLYSAIHLTFVQMNTEKKSQYYVILVKESPRYGDNPTECWIPAFQFKGTYR